MKRNIILCILFLLIIGLITLGENYYYVTKYKNNSNDKNSNCENKNTQNKTNFDNIEGIFYATDDINENIEYIKYIKIISDTSYEIGHFNSITKIFHALVSDTYEITKDGVLKLNNLPVSQNGKEFTDYLIYSDNTLILENKDLLAKENCSYAYSKLPNTFFGI